MFALYDKERIHLYNIDAYCGIPGWSKMVSSRRRAGGFAVRSGSADTTRSPLGRRNHELDNS